MKNLANTLTLKDSSTSLGMTGGVIPLNKCHSEWSASGMKNLMLRALCVCNDFSSCLCHSECSVSGMKNLTNALTLKILRWVLRCFAHAQHDSTAQNDKMGEAEPLPFL